MGCWLPEVRKAGWQGQGRVEAPRDATKRRGRDRKEEDPWECMRREHARLVVRTVLAERVLEGVGRSESAAAWRSVLATARRRT